VFRYSMDTQIERNEFFTLKINNLYGGGGGNRTRVRKSSAFRSTCVALSFVFNCGYSDGQDYSQRFPKFRILARDEPGN
jgi:hypothetical protein